VQDDLRRLADAPAFERCRPVFVPNHRPVPLLAYWADIRPKQILTRAPGPTGALVLPANEEVQKLSILDPHEPRPLRLSAPAGYRLASRNRSWLLYTSGCR
jgi:hypothetical protein